MRRHTARTASTPPPLWKSLAPPLATLEMVVIIPVRSEAARLPATLGALAAQVDAHGLPVDPGRFEVIVLANNCTDASARIVRRFAARHPGLNLQVVEVTFPPSRANVGHARACLMDEACRRLHAVGRLDGIIASTDGDTRVAADWLAATLQEVRNGADAVGGRIEMDGDTPLPAGLAGLTARDAAYQRLRNQLEHVLDPNPADPWPRHHQHFGASLAITVEAYLRVGGLPAKPFLEDEALHQALVMHDMKVRHSNQVQVVTSNRRRGRVAVGLSWQLREWSALASSAADAEVDDPARLAEDLMLRRSLRDCWVACRAAADTPATAGVALTTAGDALAMAGDAPSPLDRHHPDMIGGARISTLAASLQVPPGWLRARLQASETFGRLWLAVAARRRAKTGRDAETRMPMRQAITLLRSMVVSGEDEPAPDVGSDSIGAEWDGRQDDEAGAGTEEEEEEEEEDRHAAGAGVQAL